MQVAWSLGKCVQGSAVGLRALRAFTILTEETTHSQKMTIGDLRKKYHERGMSSSTTRRDMCALTRPFGSDGHTTQLVDVDGTMLYPRSVYCICEALGLEDKGTVTIVDADLVSLQRFKDLMYETVAYGSNRDILGGTTISRLGIKKLTGAVVNTQRARERRLGVGVQPNITELVQAKQCTDEVVHAIRMELLYRSRHRPDVGPYAFQMRNTYYGAGTLVSQLIGSYTLRDAVLASSQPVLQPEYGVQAQRQTFNFIPDLETVREILAKNVAIDVAAGHFCHRWTRVRYGRWIRFEPSFAYTDAELQAGLNYAAESLEQTVQQ
jgi:hypothetical protein